MRVLERIGDIAEDSNALADGKLSRSQNSRTQRLTFDAGHRIVEEPLLCAGREERDDVRVLEPRCQLDFASEAVDVETSAEIGRQDFYHDVATQLDFPGDEDARHSATAQLVGDLVSLTERVLELLRQIPDWFVFQPSSSRGEVVRYIPASEFYSERRQTSVVLSVADRPVPAPPRSLMSRVWYHSLPSVRHEVVRLFPSTLGSTKRSMCSV
jgi:hypothetical protein